MSAEGFDKLRELAGALSYFKKQAVEESEKVRRSTKEPYSGKIPDRLLASTEVSNDAKILFGHLHCMSAEKELTKRPSIQVSMRELCRRMHRGETITRRLIRELETAGWVETLRQGCRKVNRYRLYEASRATREAPKTLEEVKRRIARDPALASKLSASLRPKKS
jgi:predicted transcriptional regulator